MITLISKQYEIFHRSSASINDTTSTLCSPFRRRKKMIDIDDVVTVESSPTSSKNSTTRGKRSVNGITLPISSKMENNSSAKTAITRDELLSLYILKLDEEANYFKVSPTSPEEELCDCSKCQVRRLIWKNGIFQTFEQWDRISRL